MSEDSAAERKRQRLEAWKQKRQQAAAVVAPAAPAAAPPVKVSMSLNVSAKRTKKPKKFAPSPLPKSINPFGAVDDDEDDDDSENEGKRGKLSLGLGFSLMDEEHSVVEEPPAKRRKGRWDTTDTGEVRKPLSAIGDTLEKFMDKLEAGAMGNVVTQISESTGTELLSIDVGGSMMRVPMFKQVTPPPLSGGIITPEELVKLSHDSLPSKGKAIDPEALYNPSDWESDDHHGGATASDVSSTDAGVGRMSNVCRCWSLLTCDGLYRRPSRPKPKKKKKRHDVHSSKR